MRPLETGPDNAFIPQYSLSVDLAKILKSDHSVLFAEAGEEVTRNFIKRFCVDAS